MVSRPASNLAVRVRNVTPALSIPDSDRQWYSFGFGYHFNKASALDFGIAFIRGEEVEVTEAAVGSAVRATTLSNAVYYAVQYSHRF